MNISNDWEIFLFNASKAARTSVVDEDTDLNPIRAEPITLGDKVAVEFSILEVKAEKTFLAPTELSGKF